MPQWCWKHFEGREWCSSGILWIGVSTYQWSVFSTLSYLTTPNPWKLLVPLPFSRPRYSYMTTMHAFTPEIVCQLINFIPRRRIVQDYNATIEFYWAPFLLESNSDDAVIHRVSDRVVRKGSINKHGRHWKGVDIMVFNTYLWWMTGLDFKILYACFLDLTNFISFTISKVIHWQPCMSLQARFFWWRSSRHRGGIDRGRLWNGNEEYVEMGEIEHGS